MANRPFYRYGGHIELITFKEYYGMPRGHELDPIYSFGIYARFSVLNSNKKQKKQLKLWTLRRNWYGLSLYFFSRKRRSLLHPNTVQSSFFPLKSYSWKTLRTIARKARLDTQWVYRIVLMPPRHPITLLNSNKFNTAAESVKKKLNIKWLNGRCWIQILTVFNSINYQHFFFYFYIYMPCLRKPEQGKPWSN